MTSYTVALTKSGQMTLPKALREFLGLEGAKRVRLEKRDAGVTIVRKPTKEEYYADINKHISTKTRRILDEEEASGGRPPVREIMREIYQSPEMQKRWKEKLGE